VEGVRREVEPLRESAALPWVRKDDKVALLLYNCIEWLPLYFGILKTGATVVPLNFRYAADEIEYCLDKSDATILVFGPEFIGRWSRSSPKIKRDASSSMWEMTARPGQRATASWRALCSTDPMIPLSEDEDAAIYYSSGTTGFPKAILHHHRSLTQAAEMEAVHHKTVHEDVFLCIPPLYHTGAMMHWLGSQLVGGKGVLLRGVSPKSILSTVSSERCRIVWLLVPWAQDILTRHRAGDGHALSDYHLDQWRLMHIGAQPVPKSLIKRWKEVFPNHQYDTNYGLSESTGPGCVHLGLENIDHVGAIGVPGYRWQAKIVDEAGNEPVEQGAVGELCVKGPGLMECYYKDPAATAEALQDGWLHTGDMARQDEDGFYWLVDRKKDVIITGGENLYPVQIEDFMRRSGYPGCGRDRPS
jgi:long-chain acyl-CoA synthetase